MLDGSKIRYSEGDIFGPFHIFRIVSYEIILGINTNHLDYRISLSIEKNKYYRLCFCTVITINNLWGKIHLNIFRKIYRLATLRTLQRMARRF